MKYFPGDVLVTGQDILFFWVARMMMMSQAVLEKDPFHTVYLHQLVRDEKGEKMSKTKGNVIDPLDMIDLYGADALRMSNASMAALGGVLKISEDRIKGYRNFGTKLWNAFSFAQHYEIAYPGDAARPVATQTLNKWIIGETGKVREEVDAALESYRFNDAANALYAFTWGKVCDWYLEFSKPILQGEDAAAKAETEQTLRWVLDQCLILLHPIMPFITEELWGLADSRAKMLVHADWPAYTAAELVDADADREMNWVIDLIDNTRSARAQSHVPAGAKVPLVVMGLDVKGQSAWDNNAPLIQRLARIESLTAVDAFPKGCVTIPMEGGTFGLPLADLIDVPEEIARLEKTLQKLGKELGGLRGRLNNPKFVASAPDEVVAEAKENLALRESEEAQIKAAIDRLKEIG
jgi:valyl-tRNA synthetase